MDLWMIISQIWLIIIQSFVIKTFFPNYIVQIQVLSIISPVIYCLCKIINDETKYYFEKREKELEKREIEFEKREREFNLKKRELENKIFDYELREELRELGITEGANYEQDLIYIIDESSDEYEDESNDEYEDDEADMRSDTTELIN